jgi:hypothetical protein
VASHLTAVHDSRDDPRRSHLEHHELDETVVDEDPVADVHVGRQPRVGDRHLVPAGLLLRTEHDVATRLHLARGIEIADPDARTLKVSENRDRALAPGGQFTDDRDGARVLLVRSMREVDARDVESGFDQAFDCVRGRGCRAQRADDLRARMMVIGH